MKAYGSFNALAIICFQRKAIYTVEQYYKLVILKQDGIDQPAMPCSTAMQENIFPIFPKTNVAE